MKKSQLEQTNERGGKSNETGNRRLDAKTIQAIEYVLSKGYCVEIRPVKEGVKLIQVIRKQVNNEPSP